MTQTLERVKIVKEKYEKKWLNIPGVVAIGIGLIDNTPGIIISIESLEKKPALPKVIDDVPIKIQVSGPINAL